MTTKDNVHEKVLFPLEKDDDGYPPDDWESLWAYKTPEGFYSVDNIPFFVRGISPGDKLSVKKIDDELVFDGVERFSDHSVLRVMVFDDSDVDELKKFMTEMGTEYEGSHIEGLIAFDIPPYADFEKIVKFLQNGEDNEIWEYEEASLRH
jgi:nitrogen regulatory protein PII-like uncharacterized protein